ncbi:response regulator transcription factor [Nocardia salmonicida]|uniref:response regulator transcription factor n=1 Tax=Nocardia salmonicida TaxID=53431 RepID=UPI00362B0365
MSSTSAGMEGTRRIGVVDDHEIVIVGLRSTIAQCPGMEIVASAATVSELLAETTDLDLAILDLLLPDASSPADNVAQLRAAGIQTLAYTSGDRPDLVRLAAAAGALGVIRKTEQCAVVVEAISLALQGQPVGSMDWAAAIDTDTFVKNLTPREQEVLALWASGETAQGVAELLDVTTNTVNVYLKRIREKYEAGGRQVRTKAELRLAAQDDRLAPRPWWRKRH